MNAPGAADAGIRGEFHYRVRWRTPHALPGHHRSNRSGAGHEYASSAPLLDYPDPRRLDIRRSVRDPFEQLFVRTYNQHGVLPVYAVLDLTASMGFKGASSKPEIVFEFLSVLAFSAGRTGDPFGLVGCAAGVLPEFVLPATRNGESIRMAIERLREYTLVGAGAQGLIDAAPLVGYRRALVFVISDFHFPLDFTGRLLHAFARHDVVPIVLWDSAEFRGPSRAGIARVCDSETGAERYLWLRSATRHRLRETFERRRESLEAMCIGFGHKPFFLVDRVDCDHMNQFFLER